jgi:hypothetical protein
MFQTKVAETIKTHILCPVTFLEKRDMYEIMCMHTAEPDKPQKTAWRMLIAWLITNATNTLSEYVTLIAFPLQ